jgi:hypothetical protein
MRLWSIFFVVHAAYCPFTAVCADPPGSSGAGGVLNQLAIAQFPGSGRNSVEAIATGADGNIYVAGTTSSLELPVTNATQSQLGESRILRTLDRGATWQRVGNPPADSQLIAADPEFTRSSRPPRAFAVWSSIPGITCAWQRAFPAER